MCSGGLLFAQCLLESLLRIRDEVPISGRIDGDTGTILRVVLQFCEHIEVSNMGSEKYVARQTSQRGKCLLEISNNAGVATRVSRAFFSETYK
jgi:hypothetical protein